MSRLYLATSLTVIALLLSGCASLSRTHPHRTAFDPAVREKLIRQRQLGAEEQLPPDVREPPTVREKLRRGDALRSNGEHAEAMWAYLQAHRLDLDDPEPIARMGSLHLVVEPQRAESIFRQLVETHPESGVAHTGLGLALIERHNWVEARDVLTRAVGITPRSAAAYSALGVSLDRLGQFTEAREAYKRATALQSQYYEALNNLGVSYLTTEEFVAAAEVLQKAALLQSRDPAVFNNLGLALGRMGRYGEALEAFQRAGPEHAARNNLGYACFLNGDFERAIAEYERALLAGGDQKLLVLRNIHAARRAEKDLDAPGENRFELR